MNTMEWLRAACAGLMLAGLVGVPALAFQEQQGGTAGAAPPAVSEPGDATPGSAPASEFSVPGKVESERGTEVSIPGLGKLGVLPKMDFGLELLYGANGQQEKLENDPGPETDDLRIRGSVKHRF